MPQLPCMAVILNSTNAHVYHGVAKYGVISSNNQITGPHQHHPGGYAGALHSSDRWLGGVAPLPTQFDIVFAFGVIEVGDYLPLPIHGRQQLQQLRDIGVTDLNAVPMDIENGAYERTLDFLASELETAN